MMKRKLGNTGLEVSALGLGCMGMSFVYGGADEGESIRTLHRALDLGLDFFDTAEVYGPFINEELLGRAFKGRTDQVVIATKFGFNVTGQLEAARTGVIPPNARLTDSRPENVRAVAEASLKRLGAEAIDLFYQHRVDPHVPIEDTVGAMSDLVAKGKVKHLGLSEASPDTSAAPTPCTPSPPLQSEWSLWTRDPEAEVLPTCVNSASASCPYSPLGRGFLTGRFETAADLPEGDWRRSQPRFSPEASGRTSASPRR
jgi:aryl-alcohol dehydrogenase-like predicted oxidoreductase